MEVGDKLKDLNMTVDEMDRLTKAFKDEKFREMLRDYAQELSDPENKKRYEEEIKLLEQERGNTIDFIHPEPFRALRTSADGKHKCFINICASEKVGKPESKWGLSEEGRRGQCWSLPHSLHPGRQDTDPKGNKITIYDVVFHPDTLHIASKNKRFMDMVDSTAVQGVQSAFKVTLDKNNVREMRAKYKGTPQPCVIRKPIPGYKPTSEKPDPLAFPYPDDKRPTTSSQTKPAESTKNSDAKPKSFQVQPQNTKEPTTPNYTVKYRSFIDLQDFRCSRDSSKSPRPKEIVVTIDMPLLKAASDAGLEVKDKKLLLLESEKPAYRLELPLAYPVDEDEGEAKFNKQRGQLTVTLPVLPSNEAFDFAVGPADSGVSDGERQEEESEVEEEDKWKETESQKSESEEEEEEQRGVEEEKEERNTREEDLKQQTRVEKGEERGEEQMREGQESAGEERVVGEKEKLGKNEREGENSEEEEVGVEEEAKWKKQKRKAQESEEEEEKLEGQRLENETEVGHLNLQKRQQHEDRWMSELREDGRDRAAEKKDCGVTSVQCDAVDQSLSAEEENSRGASPQTEKQPVLIAAEHSRCTVKEGEENLNSCLESTPKMKTADSEEENGNEKVETDAAFLHHRSSEESQTTAAESGERLATDGANKSSEGGSGDRVSLLGEGLATGSAKPPDERENTDEDDLPKERIKPPPVLLREIDKDGNETVISDHSTSAGFVFTNTLIYELD